jgi:4-amino-4-deoxy-L-arabinose transferase-like glycosyltransferase
MALAFVLLMVPNLWLPELSREEARLALDAIELLEPGPSEHSAYRPPQRLGALVPTWTLAFFGKLLGFNEVVVRLPALLAMLGLAGLCGWVGLRVVGPHAGAVAAAAVLGNYLTFRVGLSGEPDMLGALFINAAWLGWYRLSRERKRWLYAWLVAHVFLLLAVLTIGIQAIVYFYLPIVCLRRPIKARRRLLKSEHLISVAILLIFVSLWVALSPGRASAMTNSLQGFHPGGSLSSYGKHLISFPFLMAIFFLPWTFLVWPGFCVAFRPLERDPILGKFLRTIVVSLLLCFWFVPLSSKTLAPLIGPMAILIGLNYDILVRRHGKKLLLIPKALGVIGLGFAATIFVIGWVHDPPVIPQRPAVVIGAFFCLGLAAIGTYIVFSNHLRGPIWLHVLVGVIIFRLAVLASYTVYEAELGNHRKRDAITLTSQLPANDPVYWLTEEAREIPVRMYYAKRPVLLIQHTSSLPTNRDTVYLLAEDQLPISKSRIWEPASSAVMLDDTELRMWRGQVELVDVSPGEIALGHVSGEDVSVATLTLRNSSDRQLAITELAISDPSAFFITGDLPVPLPPGEAIEFDIHLNGDSRAIKREDESLRITIGSSPDSSITHRVPVKLYTRPSAPAPTPEPATPE